MTPQYGVSRIASTFIAFVGDGLLVRIPFLLPLKPGTNDEFSCIGAISSGMTRSGSWSSPLSPTLPPSVRPPYALSVLLSH